jgi:hypothetical protein
MLSDPKTGWMSQKFYQLLAGVALSFSSKENGGWGQHGAVVLYRFAAVKRTPFSLELGANS